MTENKATIDALREDNRTLMAKHRELQLEMGGRLTRLEEHAKQIDRNSSQIDDLNDRVNTVDKEVAVIKVKQDYGK